MTHAELVTAFVVRLLWPRYMHESPPMRQLARALWVKLLACPAQAEALLNLLPRCRRSMVNAASATLQHPRAVAGIVKGLLKPSPPQTHLRSSASSGRQFHSPVTLMMSYHLSRFIFLRSQQNAGSECA